MFCFKTQYIQSKAFEAMNDAADYLEILGFRFCSYKKSPAKDFITITLHSPAQEFELKLHGWPK